MPPPVNDVYAGLQDDASASQRWQPARQRPATPAGSGASTTGAPAQTSADANAVPSAVTPIAEPAEAVRGVGSPRRPALELSMKLAGMRCCQHDSRVVVHLCCRNAFSNGKGSRWAVIRMRVLNSMHALPAVCNFASKFLVVSLNRP